MSAASNVADVEPEPEPKSEPEPGEKGFQLTDLGNARRLAAEHGGDVRYVHDWGRWLAWDGGRFRLDDTGEHVRRAKAVTRSLLLDVAAAAPGEIAKRIAAHAARSQSDRAIRAMLNLAQSEPGIPVVPEDLDRNPWVFNVANGTIDLEYGDLRAPRRDELLTKRSSVLYDPDAPCPRWLAFLDRVLDRDQDLVAFVQRAVGYTLSGKTTEQVFFLLYGAGANGKSTFLETIRVLLGEYAIQAPVETFLEHRDGAIPNDVARLRGARFVAATETPEGRRLNETLVKRMTGSDTITARFMRGEWFDFAPTFKVWLATNHLPEIRGTDDAIWRRVRAIPFTVTIPEDERDKTLIATLRHELPGILNWALVGCQGWQDNGLQPPAAVTNATTSYRADMDVLGRFLEDECDVGEALRTKAGELYTRYEYWCGRNGEDVLSQQALGRRLSNRGFGKQRGNDGRSWLGLALRRAPRGHDA